MSRRWLEAGVVVAAAVVPLLHAFLETENAGSNNNNTKRSCNRFVSVFVSVFVSSYKQVATPLTNGWPNWSPVLQPVCKLTCLRACVCKVQRPYTVRSESTWCAVYCCTADFFLSAISPRTCAIRDTRSANEFSSPGH